ncbi:MAG: Fe-S-containing hydro-lyase [Clostridiales bacterium]|jgi:fumarate hydratase subunit beta|nr:Fe-S-containing hydro-lyase [Clostridiales bacterium]
MCESARRVTAPLSKSAIGGLTAGDRVLLSGIVYTARDAAHARMIEAIGAGGALPFDIRGQAIFYAGPTPAPAGAPVGSIGPTTSARMDAFTPRLLELGLAGMIGKGLRSREVIDAIKRHGAVYFASIGGAAALTARRVKSCEVVAYGDLGPESIKRLHVEDMPLIVAIDANGNNFYEIGPAAYRLQIS